ncbi:MAG TPA: cytochrome P460 family protein [Polyangiaceae bacterium]|nr:cytochrome P460 family protein [Polyangiaceae bacterium]
MVALLAATSVATVMACSSDDDDATTETLPLESVEATEVPARDLPPLPPAMMMPEPLPPGSDTTNGLSLPSDILDWRVLGVVNIPGTDAAPGTLRVIIGNDIAVDAARSGNINPWPDGSQISHIQWSPGPNPDWDAMTAPDDFLRLTMMEKNSTRYADDGGWAYGVWAGDELRPPPAADFDRACVNCHVSTLDGKDKDYVFTVPGPLPTQEAVDAALEAPNGLALPADILDWRVVGVASRENDESPNIRVIVGNDIAIEAARSGNTNPWPDGAELAHYVWAAGDNVDSPDTINPVAFSAITLMQKNAGDYAADGGWAYANWGTPELAAPTDPEFDRGCVDCHTENVSENDFVFTRPGALPTFEFLESL